MKRLLLLGALALVQGASALAGSAALVAVQAQVPTQAPAESETGQALIDLIYHGRRNQISVTVPRVDAEVRIDGLLDEPVWADAAVLTGFSQYRPVDGLPAADSTEVLVWYSDHEIHFGIRAYEPHGLVNATLANRDRIDGDDFIRILLDTFNDRRRALLFAVNPLGIQADGIYDEGGTATRSGETQIDLSPDFLFESKGRVTAWGYEVEIRIPFKSIRYQPGRTQTWGINIMRRVQHSGYDQTWTPIRREGASFLAQSGTLEQLTDLNRGIVLDLNPVVTAKAGGAYDDVSRWRYDADRPEIGANLRWGVSENLTLNATINPDFSQVESDAGQAVYDPRQALFFPEKRPFFLEASENFQAPSQLIYTRRIASPVAAAKFTGKLSGSTNVGVLSAVDDRQVSWTGENHPVYNILRVSQDMGSSSTAGLVYTDRTDGEWYNRVAAVDARLVFARVYSLSLQGGASFTHAPWGDAAGTPIFQLNAQRRGRAFNLGLSASGAHPDFVAASGFVSRPGVARASLRPSYTLYGQPGATIESWTASLTLDGTWRYRRFVAASAADDQKLHLGSTFLLRGGWRIGTTAFIESFKYPPELYSGYYVDLGTDTVPFTGTNRIANYDLSLTLSTPQFRTFAGHAMIVGGRDENFEEWAPAYILIANLVAAWRPTDKARIEATYVQQRYHREDDRSLVSFRQIPRVKLEYQLSRPIFVRFIGEYDASMRDDLRDNSRTDMPILFCEPGPVNCSRALGVERAALRGDVLFSYQPSPGTVLFAGYGNSMGSTTGSALRELRRQNDAFFLKLSYLLRMR